MEEFIFGIIVFVIAVIIQFFVKRASKNGGQSRKEGPFSSIFEKIKNEFNETVNEYSIKEKPQTVYNEYKVKKEEKKEIINNLKTAEQIKEIKENIDQLNSFAVESYLSPMEKINNLPAIQSAVIWKEILDQPKAFHYDDYRDD